MKMNWGKTSKCLRTLCTSKFLYRLKVFRIENWYEQFGIYNDRLEDNAFVLKPYLTISFKPEMSMNIDVLNPFAEKIVDILKIKYENFAYLSENLELLVTMHELPPKGSNNDTPEVNTTGANLLRQQADTAEPDFQHSGPTSKRDLQIDKKEVNTISENKDDENLDSSPLMPKDISRDMIVNNENLGEQLNMEKRDSQRKYSDMMENKRVRHHVILFCLLT